MNGIILGTSDASATEKSAQSSMTIMKPANTPTSTRHARAMP